MKKRIVWIDFLRVIGMLSIIMIHVVGNTINTYHLSGTPKVIYHIIEQSCYFAIPLFVMLSGMYFLNKDIDFSLMLKKYCKRILLLILVFGSFYVTLELFFEYKKISIFYISDILYRILTGDLWAHMWYLYMILGLYLITPFLRLIIKNIDEKTYKYLLILLYVFSVLIPDINYIFNIKIGFTIQISSAYIFYYVYSAYIYSHDISKNYKYISIFLGLASIILIIVSSIINLKNIPISYVTTPVFLVSNMIFLLFKNKEFKLPKKIQTLICSLGTCSLGIYIIHQFYINIIYKLLKIKFILTFPYLGFILYTIFFLLISYITIYLLRKIPIVKKYLL